MELREGKNIFIKCDILGDVNSASTNVKAFKSLVDITIPQKGAFL
jgi:hypothetical protein